MPSGSLVDPIKHAKEVVWFILSRTVKGSLSDHLWPFLTVLWFMPSEEIKGSLVDIPLAS